ncbi:thioredoxin family protein [candidate division WOR-3 bacterium]|uniref:Thioredoxin family protein n=1 Tax=candidate division WOR-3 bacterium TaxID=2052148 RepID=A0A9D5KAF7_UNCW3|nr:thioredoxin family protein [candidate division WOR-3 bacterium]MBD3365222.1 thioredoxin family protein [candidate division WOR-3 bacterium]
MSQLKIEVFGSGCAKCRKTCELFKRAVSAKGIEADVRHVTDVNAGIDRGVLFTPAVFINGEKVLEGKVPTMPQVEELIGKYRN